MRRYPTAAAWEASSEPPRCASRTGRRLLDCRGALRGTLALMAWALLVLAAGGCGPAKFKPVTNEAEFDEQVLKADKPVLVAFFKGGCATCLFLDPCMDRLAEDYDGRVSFAKFELMRFWFEVTCPAIQKRHRIGFFPTVVLFVEGKEKKRWIIDYSGDAYRKVLDEVVGPAPAKETAAECCPSPSPPANPPEGEKPPPEKKTPVSAGKPSGKP
jgi:thioredoxin 1